MKSIGKYVLLLLSLIALIAVLVWLLSPEPTSQTVANVGPMLWVAAVYLGLAVVITIVMAAMNLGKGRGGNGMLNTIVFGGLAVLAVVFYFAVAKDTPVTGADGTVYSDPFTLKTTDMMLWLAYVTMVGTVVAVLWGEVRKALK